MSIRVKALGHNWPEDIIVIDGEMGAFWRIDKRVLPKGEYPVENSTYKCISDGERWMDIRNEDYVHIVTIDFDDEQAEDWLA